WYSPEWIADILVSLQMVYSNLLVSPWKKFWDHFSQTWHQQALCYVGPAVNVLQEYFEPQPTLYDLFLGYFTGNFAQRALKDGLFHLKGVLIQPSQDRLPDLKDLSHEGLIGESVWTLHATPQFAWVALNKTKQDQP